MTPRDNIIPLHRMVALPVKSLDDLPSHSNVRPLNPDIAERFFAGPQRSVPVMRPADMARAMGEPIDLYATIADESEGLDEMVADWREALRRWARAFALAAAVFAVVYFGGQLIRAVLS